jgi:hypothetical protein
MHVREITYSKICNLAILKTAMMRNKNVLFSLLQIRRPDLLQLMLDSEVSETIDDDQFTMTADDDDKSTTTKQPSGSRPVRYVKKLTDQVCTSTLVYRAYTSQAFDRFLERYLHRCDLLLDRQCATHCLYQYLQSLSRPVASFFWSNYTKGGAGLWKRHYLGFCRNSPPTQALTHWLRACRA